MTAKESSNGRPPRADASKPHLKLLLGVPATSPNVPQYLTVNEVATMLHLEPRTIYNMVSQRRIPFRKAGRQLRFDSREIDEWTKEGARR